MFAQAQFTSASFANNFSVATGNYPRALAAADLDGDGKTDVVVLNQNDSTISVFRNTSGPGSLLMGVPIVYPVGANPMSVVAGDMNGDQKPDLVIGNYGASNVQVYVNTSTTGQLSFVAGGLFATGTNPISTLLRDVDGDGKLDVITTNNNSHNFSVLRNTSTVAQVQFQSRIDLPVGQWPHLGAAEDLDGDGRVDVVVPNFNDNTITVYRNTSTPNNISFASRVDHPAGTSPFHCAIADLDGDGRPEVCVSNSTAAAVKIFPNSGTVGTINLGTPLTLNTGTSPVWINITDVDQDGKKDLAVSNFNGATISLFQNQSSGTLAFAPGVQYTVPSLPRCVIMTDMDRDDRDDMVVASSSSMLTIRRNEQGMMLRANSCSGRTLTFNAGAAGQTYQWQLNTGSGFQNVTNDEQHTGYAGPTLTISNVQVSQTNHEYRCLVNGSTNLSRKLAVDQTSTPAVTANGNATVNPGTTVTLSASFANGGSNPVFIWQDSTAQHGWQQIAAASGPTIQYTPLQTGDRVRCLLRSSLLCISSAEVVSSALVFQVNFPTALPDIYTSGIRIYPNPVLHLLTIDQANVARKWETIEVHATDGSLLRRIEVKGRSVVSIGFGQWPAGVYWLRLANRDGQRVVEVLKAK